MSEVPNQNIALLSKQYTRADFERQAGKLEAAAKAMLERHREEDTPPSNPTFKPKKPRITRLQNDEAKMRQWLQVVARSAITT